MKWIFYIPNHLKLLSFSSSNRNDNETTLGVLASWILMANGISERFKKSSTSSPTKYIRFASHFVVIATDSSLSYTFQLAHMFFGNQVTCEYWDNVWLNEGFASYLESVIADKVRLKILNLKLITSPNLINESIKPLFEHRFNPNGGYWIIFS